MGIGPSIAIPKILGKCGLEIADVDVFEINEAFASMVSSESVWEKTLLMGSRVYIALKSLVLILRRSTREVVLC
jgi:hypothetical protein